LGGYVSFFIRFYNKEESIMMHHSKKTEEVIEELSTNETVGLSSDQVLERRKIYGENRLREKKKKTAFSRFIDQFKDAMIIILLIAALISAVVVGYEVFTGEGDPMEFFEPALILIIVVFTTNFMSLFNIFITS
jgi:Ca2+-transporting ATPase